MSRRELITGNEAVAEGALAAGCNFFAGYPITPSSEIMHYMARELPRRGGVFIQAEDELAAINMVVGASLAGAKAMTATSGPGFSLMQEGIGYAVMVEAPLVLVDVMRAGPGTGQATKPAQGDLMQARWGRHGDQYLVVLAPSTPQEAYDLTAEAFNIAELLRVPVVVLSDEFIGHGREVVELREVKVISRRTEAEEGEVPFDSKDPSKAPPLPPLGSGHYLLITGSTHDGRGYRDVHSFETHYRLVKRLKDKVWLNKDKLPKPEFVGDEEPDVLIVAYGSVARSAKAAIRLLKGEGIKSALIRLKTLWPLDPNDLIKYVSKAPKLIVVPELSLGQLVIDVERAFKPLGSKVMHYGKVGGGVPIYPSEIIDFIMKNL